MHNIINLSTIINDIKRRSMIEFASKQGSRWRHYHLNYDWNMCAFVTLKDFIAKGIVHKVFIVILHTTQMTQTMSLPEVKPKIVLILVVITLH